jgi:hypothetical protein
MAPQILDERMTGQDHPATAVVFESAHRAAASFEPAMIGLDAIIGVLCGVVDRPRQQLADSGRQRR